MNLGVARDDNPSNTGLSQTPLLWHFGHQVPLALVGLDRGLLQATLELLVVAAELPWRFTGVYACTTGEAMMLAEETGGEMTTWAS